MTEKLLSFNVKFLIITQSILKILIMVIMVYFKLKFPDVKSLVNFSSSMNFFIFVPISNHVYSSSGRAKGKSKKWRHMLQFPHISQCLDIKNTLGNIIYIFVYLKISLFLQKPLSVSYTHLTLPTNREV